jgi:sugar lactone lactonase YvrE
MKTAKGFYPRLFRRCVGLLVIFGACFSPTVEAQTMVRFAGTGLVGYSGTGGPAVMAKLSMAWDTVTDTMGNTFISDAGNNRVRKVDPGGVISDYAGNGSPCVVPTVPPGAPDPPICGEGGPALSAQLTAPHDLAVDAAGNLYVGVGNRVFRVDAASQTMTRVVGSVVTKNFGLSANNKPATNVTLLSVKGLAVGKNGRLYVSDGSYIRFVDNGWIGIFAGGGSSSVDGHLASESIIHPNGIAVDTFGNLYFVDLSNKSVRKIDVDTTTITTVAGPAAALSPLPPGFSGDGGPATAARFTFPFDVTIDSHNNLFVSDISTHRVRKISSGADSKLNGSPDEIITTIAGDGTECLGSGACGDGGIATLAQLKQPRGIDLDLKGNLLIVEGFTRVRKVAGAGKSSALCIFLGLPATPAAGGPMIVTVAGTPGVAGLSGDGGPGTLAKLHFPWDVVTDDVGNLYISEAPNRIIRKLGPTGIISTFIQPPPDILDLFGLEWDVGTRSLYFSTAGVAPNENGSGGNSFVYRVDVTTGTAVVVAGTPGRLDVPGESVPATSAPLETPSDLALDAQGNLYIADHTDNTIRKIDANGIIRTIVNRYARGVPSTGGGGMGPAEMARGFSGDGGPAVAAHTSGPKFLAIARSGTVFFSDGGNNRIRRLLPQSDGSYTIDTIAGSGVGGFCGEIPLAIDAALYDPSGVALDAVGNLFVADSGNHMVHKISTDGTITTLAGTGRPGYNGDNIPATTAALNGPRGLTVDCHGDLYIADYGNNIVRKIPGVGVGTLGDLTGDCKVSVADTLLLLRFVLGLHDFRLNDRLAVDLNGDGKINIGDAVLSLRRAVGL